MGLLRLYEIVLDWFYVGKERLSTLHLAALGLSWFSPLECAPKRKAPGSNPGGNARKAASESLRLLVLGDCLGFREGLC